MPIYAGCDCLEGDHSVRISLQGFGTFSCPQEALVYKKILVPLDGSSRAEKIFPHVEDLAGCTGASVIFMEVVEPVPTIIDAQDAVITMQLDEIRLRENEAQTYLAACVTAFDQKKIPASMHVLNGPIVEAICQFAEKEDVDLIAMASHGRSGLARVVYGSVAAGVLQRLDRPLLLIRARDEA
jgi:nucleotide-binding universal stress UspA family protein